ncbi:hypothetical protein SRB17_02110 [Streptomyces sp. RB17]|nr:hypothetical protein [Streptomyces sp. RB17]
MGVVGDPGEEAGDTGEPEQPGEEGQDQAATRLVARSPNTPAKPATRVKVYAR